MTMVSELVLTRNQLLEIRPSPRRSTYKVPLQRLSHVTAELQEGVMKTRMQPIGKCLAEAAARGSRSVVGTRQADRAHHERRRDRAGPSGARGHQGPAHPHGAQFGRPRHRAHRRPGKRPAKPARGTIRLAAYHEGGTITIEIADDGKGLDLAAIRRKAVERNVASQSEIDKMTDAQVAKFIFHPGFSTAKAVTSVSGRGVGMDVVKTNIELIGGVIDINTQLGRGTTFTIKIPLTLAIIAALIVKAGDLRYAVPQVAVLELVRVDKATAQKVERINGSPVLRLRERLLPIVTLTGVLGQQENADSIDSGFVVVAQVGRQRFGILVDEVFHTEEIVVKPMSSKLRHLPLFAGNTILGDGAVVLIVDPNGIARQVSQGTQTGVIPVDAEPEETDAADAKATLLVFKGGGRQLQGGAALARDTARGDRSQQDRVGRRTPLIQYRGRLMPLVPADQSIEIRSEGTQALVVFSDRRTGHGPGRGRDHRHRRGAPRRGDRGRAFGPHRFGGPCAAAPRRSSTSPTSCRSPMTTGRGARTSRRSAARRCSWSTIPPSSADMLSPVLKAAGYNVITAGSAEAALTTLVNNSRIDVVVCDLEMPGRNGFDLVAAMRKGDERVSQAPGHRPLRHGGRRCHRARPVAFDPRSGGEVRPQRA